MVLLSSAAETRRAIDVLNSTKFGVPGALDMHSGEPTQLQTFSVLAELRRPARPFPLLINHSKSLRVAADFKRAKQLAAILDARREVPADSQLQALLGHADVVAALQADSSKPTDALDLSIAYLRRVHFVALYSGRRFLDELDLLMSGAPSHRRIAEYIEVPAQGQAQAQAQAQLANSDSNAPESSVLASSSSVSSTADDAAAAAAAAAEAEAEAEAETGAADENEENAEAGADADADAAAAAADGDDNGDGDADAGRKRDRSTGEEEGQDDQDQEPEPLAAVTTTTASSSSSSSTEAKQRQNTQRGQGSNAARRGGGGEHVRVFDKAVEELIQSLQGAGPRGWVQRKFDKDVADAAVIAEREEPIFTALVQGLCPTEGEEGKARCCFPGCAKLFKNYDFLKKHMRSRHEILGLAEALPVYEPFMRLRYNKETLLQRPLPPLDVEGPQGVEQRGVRDVVEALNRAQAQRGGAGPGGAGGGVRGGRGGMGMGMGMVRVGSGPRQDGRGFGGRGGGGGRGQLQHGGGSFNRGAPPPPPPPPGAPDASSSQQRTSRGGIETGGGGTGAGTGSGGAGAAVSLHQRPRMDIDAPKEGKLHVDYGVAALQPVKRRKVLVKNDD
jgi:hypothetical protein